MCGKRSCVIVVWSFLFGGLVQAASGAAQADDRDRALVEVTALSQKLLDAIPSGDNGSGKWVVDSRSRYSGLFGDSYHRMPETTDYRLLTTDC